MGLSASVIGASGYAGGELLRILLAHPKVSDISAFSKSNVGKKVGDVHPNLVESELVFEKKEDFSADVVFFATPHGAAMEQATKVSEDSRIIDLSADFRLPQAAFEKAYGVRHASPELLPKAVYGLPEAFREKIRGARLVANPGCYPTGAELALLPLAEKKMLQGVVHINSESGASGAGATPAPHVHFADLNENIHVYKVGEHRHQPEIEHTLSTVAGKEIRALFVPSIVPITRGIFTTAFVQLEAKTSRDELMKLYKKRYAEEPFVRVVEQPRLSSVRLSNVCEVSVYYSKETNTAVAVSAIDNLVKGAAGEAVQNMNLVFNFSETAGLEFRGARP